MSKASASEPSWKRVLQGDATRRASYCLRLSVFPLPPVQFRDARRPPTETTAKATLICSLPRGFNQRRSLKLCLGPILALWPRLAAHPWHNGTPGGACSSHQIRLSERETHTERGTVFGARHARHVHSLTRKHNAAQRTTAHGFFLKTSATLYCDRNLDNSIHFEVLQ
jgi:hypothetical protein